MRSTRFSLNNATMCVGALATVTLLGLVACEPGPPQSTGSDTMDTGIFLPGHETEGETDGETEGETDADTDAETEGASTSEGEAPMNCGTTEFTLSQTPANVMLVLDKSYSMIDHRWDHDGDSNTPVVTRWHSLHNVVRDLVDAFDDQMNLGATLFPSVDVEDNDAQTACIVPSVPDAAVASNGGADVLAALPPADSMEIYGGTPTRSGIATALDHFANLDDGLPQAIILVTDGAANCAQGVPSSEVFSRYDEGLDDLVAQAYTQQGIPTYVVGIDIVNEYVSIPQANPYERLNEVALAGGVAQTGPESFYNTVDEDELYEALEDITYDVASCTVPLDSPPDEPELVTVEIGGTSIDRVDDCSQDDGWTYAGAEGSYDAIRLCGTACELLTTEGQLQATYGCVPVG